jgi:acyl carrier protein
LSVEKEILNILDEVLSLRGRSSTFSADTPLLGELPEFDSMAVVGIVTSIEERFDLVVDDDELDASAFATVGTLTSFVEQKLL